MGISFGRLAKTKLGNEAEVLYQQALEKFQKATEIKPDKHEAFYNWGGYLLRIADNKTRAQKLKIYQRSEELLIRGVQAGSNVYNLACVYALQNKKGEALKALSQALENDEITKAFVLEDEDWKDFLDDPEFQALLT